MKNNIIYFTLVILLVQLATCSKQPSIQKENVLEIKNVGLREGVFIRRYQLTGEHGSNTDITADMLKNYISRVLEPNYLLIQHAYDLGLDKDAETARKIKDYQINLLADSHPIKYQELTILKNDLRDFYQKKSVKYDVEIFQTNSYSNADSMHKLLLKGQKIQPPKEYMDGSFPYIFHDKELLYGERLHPELYPILEKMNNGEISQPVYTAPIWTLLKLNTKSENNKLSSFEDMEQELLAQVQVLDKYNQQKELVAELFEKYQVSPHTEMYSSIATTFTITENTGSLDKDKLEQSELNDTFLTINNEEITLADFIQIINQTSKFRRIPTLTENDVEQFVYEYCAQYVLYLDALEKGVDQNTLIQDKLQNKEHRILLSKYLNDEIMKKIVITEKDAKAHYNNTRDKWSSDYKNVSHNIISDLRSIKLAETKSDILDKLRKKYNVRYNDPLLKTVAQQLTNDKKSAAATN